MDRRTVISSGIGLLALGLCSLVSIAGGRTWQYSIDSNRKAAEIAKRLSVDFDWESVRNHVYCNTLKVGQDGESIRDKLELVGPSSYQAGSADSAFAAVVFDDYFSRVELSDLYLYFDREGLLTRKSHQRGLGDEVPITY